MTTGSPAIECDIVEPNGEVMVYVRGDLDVATIDEFERCLEEALAPKKDLFVDLSGTEFVDGRGVQAIYWAARRARDNGLQLAVSSPSPLLRTLLTSSPGAPEELVVLDPER